MALHVIANDRRHLAAHSRGGVGAVGAIVGLVLAIAAVGGVGAVATSAAGGGVSHQGFTLGTEGGQHDGGAINP